MKIDRVWYDLEGHKFNSGWTLRATLEIKFSSYSCLLLLKTNPVRAALSGTWFEPKARTFSV